jgi:hypothetical protein
LKLLLPFCFLASFLCSFASCFSNLDKYFGLDILFPSLSIRKSFNPKSIPIILSVEFFSSILSILQHTEIKYLSVGVLVIVTFNIFPCISLDFANLTQPNLGSFILFPLISILLLVNVVL